MNNTAPDTALTAKATLMEIARLWMELKTATHDEQTALMARINDLSVYYKGLVTRRKGDPA